MGGEGGSGVGGRGEEETKNPTTGGFNLTNTGNYHQNAWDVPFKPLGPCHRLLG